MKFSKAFKLGKPQGALDFVDVSTSYDTRVFLDPYAIEIKQNVLALECAAYVHSYFNAVLDALRAGRTHRARELTEHLSEPKDTFIGVSKGKPKGRGVGREQADHLLSALRRSRAFETGLLADLSETELMVEGVGRDKVSDLTTNIIREKLVEYTIGQCDLLEIDLGDRTYPSGPMWDPSSQAWKEEYVKRPIVRGKPVLLIPKHFVRLNLSLNSQEFYNYHMLEFLQAEHISAGSSLVQFFRKSKKPYVTKKSLKRVRPKRKDDVVDFIREHPHVLEVYKNLKGAEGALQDRQIDPDFNERRFAEALIEELERLPRGMKAAGKYHSLMTGVLPFLFYPNLIQPVKEREIHSGRKRIDLSFTNAAESGFFSTVLARPQTRASWVMIECKNYSSDLGNPELDQMSGRFSPARGKFGIICCRELVDAQLMLRRCRDTARDDRGHIITLEDSDIVDMLKGVVGLRRRRIDEILHAKLSQLAE
ncbi:hypothetical protein [Vitreimonas sp.]|uniref:hypothetical protein n=1 Tax=Vitreimonas sp. TaxID=3069702 RepID=UPI002EDA53A5